MTIQIDPSRWRQDPPPWRHQIIGARAIVAKPAFFVGDVPRIGKSRQVVDAASELRHAGIINTVLIVCPVSARGVWGDTALGQIRKYCWKRSRVVEFHARTRELWTDPEPEILFVISNYDFLRSERHLEELVSRIADASGDDKSKVMLVLDESSAVGTHTSQQSKAVAKLRTHCGRVVMLNGTPGEPPKLWSQFNILDHVLDSRYKSFTTYKWQYAEYEKEPKKIWTRNPKGGPAIQKEVHAETGRWKNMDRLSAILAPYCIRRERKDCPELRDIKISYGFREVPLSKETWRMYQELKREAVIALSTGELYLSPNANTRLLRLAQITSGHLGGFEEGDPVRQLSTEKIDWLVDRLKESTERCSIIWCRWVREREELAVKLSNAAFGVYQIYGGQPSAERRVAELAFADGGKYLGVVGSDPKFVMLAQPQAGGMALDMSAATEIYRLSRDYNLRTEEQSDDRPLGQAQKLDCVPSTDVLATGPNGERTLDHTIAAAVREKKNLARMTTAAWRKELEAE